MTHVRENPYTPITTLTGSNKRMRRLSEHERASSFLAAQRGEIELERGLHGARLREALIRAGCVVPAGWAKHEIFETDTRGRQEAAETIAFEEREIASHVEADNDDPEVCTKLVSLLQLDDGSRRILYDRRAKRLRAWRELFPYSRDDDRGWA